MVLNQGVSAASRILPIIDQENQIKDSPDAKSLEVKSSEIKFNNLNFSYEVEEGKTLESINPEHGFRQHVN